METVKDWRGNEVKEGMTIYFVRTKPGFLESGRFGMMIPQTGQTILEDEREWKERKNKEVWELGDAMEVFANSEGRLFVKPSTETSGGDVFYETKFLDTPFWLTNEYPTIAIKGISDKK